MRKKMKTRVRRLLSLSCAIAVFSSCLPSYADDVDNLRQETNSLQNQLNQLNQELNTLSSEITTLASQIEESDAKIEKARLDLAAAQLNEEMQYTAMKKRIKFMYESGNPSFLHMLCSAKSMADFLNRTEFVQNVTEYDRKMLEELKELRVDIEEKEQNLQKEQEALVSMQATLDERKNALHTKINSTSDELELSAEALANAEAAQDAADRVETSSPDSSTSESNPTEVPTDDFVLFAALLQCEAGSSNYDALLAVATVVMNRVESSRYPNNLYDVIYQRGQFSPTWNGSLKRVLSKGPASLCYQVAQDALNGKRLASVQNCLYFNASWTGKPGTIVGGNVFW